MLQGVPKPFGHRFMDQGKKSELKKISETSTAHIFMTDFDDCSNTKAKNILN